MIYSSDTIAARATPPGRGGVAVVRVSGPAAFRVAASLTGRAVTANAAGQFFFSVFRDATGQPIDSGLVLVFAAPKSYTGEDVVEFQGHGGEVAPRRVLEAVLAAGARLAERGEFTRRAFLNGRLDLSAAEAVIDLVDAHTARAADEALTRLHGKQAASFEAFYTQALTLSAQAEHALDFSEDELPPTFFTALAAECQGLTANIARHLATAREGKILREGALVVLAGAPNAGKSSLLNALLGERRAIVSAVAGTTRDTLEEWLEIGGWPVRLTDTAGLHATADVIEAEGVQRAQALIARADVVLALDCSFSEVAAKTLRIHAKCDLGPGEGLPVSAKTGEGLAELRAAIAARLATLAARGDEANGADITTRQRELLADASAALARAQPALAVGGDLVVAAGELRVAAEALGRLTGKVYTDDLLDTLFSRFCIGK